MTFKTLSLGAFNSKGVALIMVLWIITILSVVVLEFCFAMRTELNITRNDQQQLQLYAAAQGSVQRTIAELVLKHDPRMQQLRRAAKEEEIPAENKEWITDGREYRMAFEGAEAVVRVVGEAGKISINQVSDASLRKIMTSLGLEGETRDMVVDSILDWRDPDDFIRINGAENEFYQTLKEPYDCKNGTFDSVEELLLVRGVTPELYYGKKKEGDEDREERVALKDIFSVYAAGEQIDINSASLPVLRVVLGLPAEVCRLLIKARGEKGFENFQDLLLRVPELSPFRTEVQGLIVFRAINPYYTIEATGRSKEAGSTRGIRVVVKVDPREGDRYKIIQWLDFLL
jgi:general secretion pathway protein K